jgi:hypothetical protein
MKTASSTCRSARSTSTTAWAAETASPPASSTACSPARHRLGAGLRRGPRRAGHDHSRRHQHRDPGRSRTPHQRRLCENRKIAASSRRGRHAGNHSPDQISNASASFPFCARETRPGARRGASHARRRVTVVEVTMTVPGAVDLLKELKREYGSEAAARLRHRNHCRPG